MRKRNLSQLFLIAGLSGLLLVGGAAAFFTDSDTKVNTFTIGTISVKVEEPGWDEDKAKDFMPGDTIEKAPQATNDGHNSEYVFLTVELPLVAKEDGATPEPGSGNASMSMGGAQANALKLVPLFNYEVNDGWVEVDVRELNYAPGFKVYAYAANNEMTVLEKGQTTPALFDEVTMIDFDNQETFADTDVELVVSAYAIQTENLDNDVKDPLSVWKLLASKLS